MGWNAEEFSQMLAALPEGRCGFGITVNRIRRGVIVKIFLIVLDVVGINKFEFGYTILTMIYTMVYTIYNNVVYFFETGGR